MKRPITFIFIFLTTTALLVQTDPHEAVSNSGGAPAGRTGSPGDGGATCTTCHTGTASPSSTQIITSNIPASGYIAGQTYTITATVSQTGINEFGFQISPQNNSGALMGTIINTSPSQTQVLNSKYITHTSGGIAGTSNSKTWSFNWVAPAAGSGDVTFYGAFNFSNNNGTGSGDIIRTNTLTTTENTTTNLVEFGQNGFSVSVYPNPIRNEATVALNSLDAGTAQYTIYNSQGQAVSRSERLNIPSGNSTITLDQMNSMQTGIYRLVMVIGEKEIVKSLVKL